MPRRESVRLFGDSLNNAVAGVLAALQQKAALDRLSSLNQQFTRPDRRLGGPSGVASVGFGDFGGGRPDGSITPDAGQPLDSRFDTPGFLRALLPMLAQDRTGMLRQSFQDNLAMLPKPVSFGPDTTFGTQDPVSGDFTAKGRTPSRPSTSTAVRWGQKYDSSGKPAMEGGKLVEQAYDVEGNPVFDAEGNPLTRIKGGGVDIDIATQRKREATIRSLERKKKGLESRILAAYGNKIDLDKIFSGEIAPPEKPVMRWDSLIGQNVPTGEMAPDKTVLDWLEIVGQLENELAAQGKSAEPRRGEKLDKGNQQRRERARKTLRDAGYDDSDASVETFLKNNPKF